MAYPVCCLFLQEHTIFKFKSFSGVQSLVSRCTCHPLKSFFVLLPFQDFAQMSDTSVRDVTISTQRCKWNGVWSLMLAACWWLVQHWLKPFSEKMIPKDLFCLHSYKNAFPKKHLGKKRGHSEFQTQEWCTSGFFCKIPIKDLNIFEQTVIGIVLKILSVFLLSLVSNILQTRLALSMKWIHDNSSVT